MLQILPIYLAVPENFCCCFGDGKVQNRSKTQ